VFVSDSNQRLEAWETSAPGPYVSIRTGGPLDGRVTLTAMDGGRIAVEASWGGPHARHSVTVERATHVEADAVARAWAADLVAGRSPSA
jgi:hypothetical protein